HQGAGQREVLRSRGGAGTRERGYDHGRRAHQRGGPGRLLHGRDPGQPGAARGGTGGCGLRGHGRVPLLRRLRPGLGVAGAFAHASQNPVPADERHLGRRGRHRGSPQEPNRDRRGRGSRRPRPVPLSYEYVEMPLEGTVELACAKRGAAVPRAFRAGRGAVHRAGLCRASAWHRRQRELIKEAVKGTRFTTPFGKILQRLLAAGVGVHHAGMRRATGFWWSAWPSRGSCPSSAAPTPWAWASTCPSTPSCSRR
ncbi:MAG: hypothetical protein ACLSVD_04480, partial [Eggerthellaceae bacterium]